MCLIAIQKLGDIMPLRCGIAVCNAMAHEWRTHEDNFEKEWKMFGFDSGRECPQSVHGDGVNACS